MIEVAGAVQRSFIFPASRPAAFAFYGDFSRIIGHLSHISLTRTYEDGRFRVLYDSTELGLYHIRIYCDAQVEPDQKKWVLRVKPLEGKPPIKPQAGLNSSKAQGLYSSESVFHDEGGHTLIDYKLKLNAQLPPPLALKLVPGKILDEIAWNITHWRIHQIADSFIESSIAAFNRHRRR